MKTFNSLKKLLDYCLKCPVCKNNRQLSFSVGPDNFFKYKNYTYSDNILIIYTSFSFLRDEIIGIQSEIINYPKYNFYVNFIINCQTNEFQIESDKFISAKDEDFWFAIYSNCQCDCSINSLDIQTSFNLNTFHNIGIEQESIYLTKTPHMFHLSIHPSNNEMKITKLIRNESGELIDNSDVINFPYIDIDFSNEESAVEKLKMMIVFS